MYDKRVKIFIGVNLVILLVCVLRLAQMQLMADSKLRDEIAQLRLQRMKSTPLKTVRGSILDRNGRVLAEDVPQFQITISYELSSYADERVLLAKALQAREKPANSALVDLRNDIDANLAELKQITDACAKFGAEPDDLADRIRQTNDDLWNLRTFIAWRRNKPDPNLLVKYDDQVGRVPQAEAFADFERHFPDEKDRYRKVIKVDDIPEIKTRFPLAELKTDDDVFAAQMEFIDMNDVQVVCLSKRSYPHGDSAAQTIGWVGAATMPQDINLFKDDPLARYLKEGDVCGREDGVEYVCEAILRGRRGEEVSDANKSLIRRTQPQFGQDVQLTIDIDLQRQIEEYATDPAQNPNCDSNMAIVVLDISSGDILAMVSLPSYDLNRARYDYGRLENDANRPLINRVVNALYPPGSVVKPLILAAGLETGAIRADEVIHCRAEPAPEHWPNCWIWRQSHEGHDSLWENNARNALRGSCNIYFSHLADLIDTRPLQQWLFKFGYGRQVLEDARQKTEDSAVVGHPSSVVRYLKESAGQIGSINVPASARIAALERIPPLNPAERRYFGIGHGNLRATPLQVANSFAALARGGQYKPPRLFKSEIRNHVTLSGAEGPKSDIEDQPVDLGISAATLQVIHDGLGAVVNESGGTAHEAFRTSDLVSRGVRVYGKTGSTEQPIHAWFAGFAEDATGPRVSVAVVVEGGEHGSRDAAPIGRDVLRLCARAGYVGK